MWDARKTCLEGLPVMEKPRLLPPDQLTCLRYSQEDTQAYFLVDREGSLVRVPKSRALMNAVSNPLSAAFQILAAAFLGLAPAGLGTLLLAPLAVIFTLPAVLRGPKGRAEWARIAVVWMIAAGLTALAVPLSVRFLERLP